MSGKRICAVVVCLCMLLSAAVMPASAAGTKLFDLDADGVATVEIKTDAWADQMLTAEQDGSKIQALINSLNAFEYAEIADLTDYTGWYASVNITNQDGTVQSIELWRNGASAPKESPGRRICYRSANGDDYFGDDWMRMFYQDPYTDVKLWQDRYVKWAYENNVMMGTSETTFSKEMPMTRGMMVTVLGRMEKIDVADYDRPAFADVGASHYAYPYVAWAAEHGIVNGTSATTFSPDAPVTREEISVVQARYAKALGLAYPLITYDEPVFTDIENTSQEFRDSYLMLFQAHALLYHDIHEHFEPMGTVTRWDAARLMYNTYDRLYVYGK